MRRDTVFNLVLREAVPSPEDVEHVSPNEEISRSEWRRVTIRVRVSKSVSVSIGIKSISMSVSVR
jgi:hypothetical protein